MRCAALVGVDASGAEHLALGKLAPAVGRRVDGTERL